MSEYLNVVQYIYSKLTLIDRIDVGSLLENDGSRSMRACMMGSQIWASYNSSMFSLGIALI